jgi:hypothetical protein
MSQPRRVLAATFLLATSLVLAATANAAPPSRQSSEYGPRAVWVEIDATAIDGHLRGPAALYVSSRQRAVFARLLHLRKSFVPALAASERDPALR